MKNLPAVLILAGGKSERFWPLEEKNLLPFLGVPLLFHQIDLLRKVGFSEIIIVCNQNLFSKLKTSEKTKGLKLVIQKGEGQAAAVLSASQFLGEDEKLLIVNANDVVEERLFSDVLKIVWEKEIDGSLVAVEMEKYFPGGYLVADKNGFVKKVVEKPKVGQEPSNLVRIVVDYFQNAQEIISLIKKCGGPKDKVYEEALSLMTKEKKIKLIKYNGFWGYLKYPWHVLGVMDYFLGQIKKSQIAKNSQIAKSAVVEGPVIIKEGVRILENAKIVGPCYLGKEVVVGNNAMIRQSMVGEGCIVGFSTDMVRSYVGADSWFHANYIGDSIVADNVSLGSGAVLANLRLDEKNIFSFVRGEKINTQREKLGVIIGEGSRVGVNTSIMPGVKVGRNCFVGVGLVLGQDLPDNTYCYTKQELILKENKFQVLPKGREKFRKQIK